MTKIEVIKAVYGLMKDICGKPGDKWGLLEAKQFVDGLNLNFEEPPPFKSIVVPYNGDNPDLYHSVRECIARVRDSVLDDIEEVSCSLEQKRQAVHDMNSMLDKSA